MMKLSFSASSYNEIARVTFVGLFWIVTERMSEEPGHPSIEVKY